MSLFKKKNKCKFLEKETDCIFCGKTFQLKDVLFVQKTDDKRVKPDEKHQTFMSGFISRGQTDERRYLICENWVDYAIKEGWTELKGLHDKPFVVNDEIFQNPQVPLEEENEDNILDEPEAPASMEEVMDFSPIGNSTHMLCPHCHCELPANFEKYRKVRVGLFGGRRSGKTSFMTASTLKMTSSNGIPGAVSASIITESNHMYKRLLEEAKQPVGLAMTPAGKVFPLALLITPKEKEPFFLILQDIPGEYTNPENIHHLANDNSFLNQEAFLAIVDINMFVNTDMKTELEDAEARIRQIENELLPTATDEGEKAILEAEKEQWENKSVAIRERICLAAFGDIYNNFGFATFCNHLKSVQIVFTKIDQWVKAAEEPLKRHLMMGIAQDHSSAHDKDNNRIKPATLRIASENVETVLGRPDVIPPVGDPMGHIIGLFEQNNPEINIHNNAYCAIACPPGSGFEGECLNVLDPILNICVWEDILPTVAHR